MEYLTHVGITYEITVLALAHETGFSVELADMSLTGAIIAEARVKGHTITLVHQAPMPVEIYSWWTAAVTDTARSQVIGDEAGC